MLCRFKKTKCHFQPFCAKKSAIFVNQFLFFVNVEKKGAVLLLFTGGTISMSEDPATGALRPIDFNRLQEYMPELKQTGVHVKSIPFLPLIDSSDVQPDTWEKLALIIEENYDDFDGFVVLHGTDTMAHSASALSFMLENLSKPVIFTGAQLPIGMMRSDAKENLLTAIEIASAQENGMAIVPEVCIFFEDTLFRGNRTTKKNAEHFNAFNSYNYPALAKAGVHIKYFRSYIHYSEPGTKLRVRTKVDRNVAILKLFPGITQFTVHAILNIPGLKAVVLESFGAGNAPRRSWFFDELKAANEKGILIVNKSQCSTGTVEMGRYETSLNLLSAGVISGYDCTTEALVAKLMCLLGEYDSLHEVRHKLSISICGEMTIG
ncbi:MAG: asparaginase [Bacteroidetes bacterium]|jgi:L-asparaginase|nr:asparaginase [Bacteroidota bacterium]